MRRTRAGLCGAIVLAVVSLAVATQYLVPSEQYQTIQSAIIAASDGDVISVWGPEGFPPPYTYNENVDYLGKSLVVVNRSFIEEISGYPPSWEYVTICGSSTAPVVTMTGSNLVVPRVVLKGFTITGGGGTYGGGIKCQDVVAVLENNHVQD